MKHLFALLAIIILAVSPAKATNIDSWSYYLAHYDATCIIEGEGIVYAVMNGNLVSYDPNTTEVRTYDILSTGLSAKNIKFIGYSDNHHCLVIVYTDGNIDILNVRNGNVANIPHFMKNPDRDFSLNNLKVADDFAILCTNEGFIWIDLKTNTILGRYTIGATNAVICYNGNVYAALKAGGMLTAPLGANYLDSSVWQRLFDYEVSDLGVFCDYLYILCPNIDSNREMECCGTWGMDKDGELFLVTGWPPLHFSCNKNHAIMYSATNIFELKATNPKAGSGFSSQHGCHTLFPASDGGCWTSSSNGITHYAINTANKIFEPDAQPINGGGPTHETPYYLSFAGDRLFVAAGRLDPTDKDHRPYNASWYDSDNEEWNYFEVPYGGSAGAGPWLRKNAAFRDASAIAQDPLDPNHHFVTSGSQGIFEYRNGKLVAQYTEQRHIENNVAVGTSVIKSSSNSLSYDYVRTNSAIFDKDGNLFITNSGGGDKNRVDTIVWCLKRDGTWQGFYYAKIADYSCFENSIFDSKGRLWITQRRTAGDANGGFLCMDFNGTLSDVKDDVYTFRGAKFTNQDGTEFTYQQALSIAEDKTGRIWLGTEAGLLVVDDPDTWSNPNFTITQVKVPRPDGIYADYLLAGTTVTAIAVDGADRKWIGTLGDGVYLMSADGITQIHHFTRANSPLISDNITSIACHPTNGEVFIGTDFGLVSYHSDASESEESLSRDNLRVYPNPVRPDYSGPVVLDGLVYDSDVKVVSTAGHVVAAGTSVGGTFTWDGRGPSGARVGSGVYYFMISSPDGKETTVAKVAVVR